MKIGLGLPISAPETLLDWARRAEAGAFSSLGLLDRLVWHNPEPLVALAAIAGATSRIRVQTEVLLVPLRDTALLAKQCATLDRMSGGRFTIGVGVGGRADDFDAVGRDVRRRGAMMDTQLAELRRLWSGAPHSARVGPIGPVPRPRSAPHAGPEILVGGFRDRALQRVGRWGDGFLGAAPPSRLDRLFRSAQRSWQQQGRSGRPRLVAQANVALGPAAVITAARTAIAAYYGDPATGAVMLSGLLTTAAALRAQVNAYADLGADEVMCYCWSADLDQVDRIAAALP